MLISIHKRMSKLPTIICIKKNNLQKLGYKNLEEWVKDPNNLYIGRRNMYVKGADESKWKKNMEEIGAWKCTKNIYYQIKN